MKLNLKKAVVLPVLCGVIATAAMAAVTFDVETGQGFVGKGDVQLAFGWNNKQLQDNVGDVRFIVDSKSETSWECLNPNNDKIQERERKTTTKGVLSYIARERNQITGFILTGYDGVVHTTSQGPALESCPTNFILVEGSTQTQSVGADGLSVKYGSTVVPLPNTPTVTTTVAP